MTYLSTSQLCLFLKHETLNTSQDSLMYLCYFIPLQTLFKHSHDMLLLVNFRMFPEHNFTWIVGRRDISWRPLCFIKDGPYNVERRAGPGPSGFAPRSQRRRDRLALAEARCWPCCARAPRRRANRRRRATRQRSGPTRRSEGLRPSCLHAP